MNKIYIINQINYEIENKKIVHNLNCEIEEGITIINGPNGAGKTTFINFFSAIIQPTSGNIIKHFNAMKTNISFVFQEPIFSIDLLKKIFNMSCIVSPLIKDIGKIS